MEGRNPTQNEILEAWNLTRNGSKLAAVKLIHDVTKVEDEDGNLKGWGLKKSKEFVDTIEEHLDMGKLKQSYVIGNALENKQTEIAQKVVGFSLRDIEEPSGYVATIVESSISQLPAYHTLVDPECILVEKTINDKRVFIAGHYFRFKKDIENPEIYKSIIKL
jgi:hypothetical protein